MPQSKIVNLDVELREEIQEEWEGEFNEIDLGPGKGMQWEAASPCISDSFGIDVYITQFIVRAELAEEEEEKEKEQDEDSEDNAAEDENGACCTQFTLLSFKIFILKFLTWWTLYLVAIVQEITLWCN